MEKPRTPMLGLFRRHFAGCKFPTDGAKAVDKNVGGLEKFWDGRESKEIPTSSYPGGKPPWVYSGFQTWNFASSSGKTEGNKEGVGKTFNPLRDDLSKNGCNFGSHNIIFDGHAFFKGIYRPVGPICKPTRKFGLGSESPHPPGPEAASSGNALHN